MGFDALSADVHEQLGKLEQLCLIRSMANCMNASTLKQWTGQSMAGVVYFSSVDLLTDECLFQNVKGNPNISIVATTTDCDVFDRFHP